MTTTTNSTCNGNRFDNGKDSEKVTPAPSSSPIAQEWFDAQALPILPLHLQLMLLGS